MKLDFTISKYNELIQALKNNGYEFQTIHDFLTNPSDKSIVLRHDVDLKPENSLRFARIQHDYGIKGTYYFRAKSYSWKPKIVKEIHDLGHEIGYHYENLSSCNGNFERAILDFQKNLSDFRNLVPITTICMHGSPLSKYDNKDLWDKYSYKNYDIIGEPYFDIEYNNVFYLTDTGRSWDGAKFSIRDKVSTNYTEKFSTTDDIIAATSKINFPKQIVFTFHPQRWNDNFNKWFIELISQSIKNSVKKQMKK
jgi:hypothetical protein